MQKRQSEKFSVFGICVYNTGQTDRLIFSYMI